VSSIRFSVSLTGSDSGRSDSGRRDTRADGGAAHSSGDGALFRWVRSKLGCSTNVAIATSSAAPATDPERGKENVREVLLSSSSGPHCAPSHPSATVHVAVAVAPSESEGSGLSWRRGESPACSENLGRSHWSSPHTPAPPPVTQ
jgi:hypothetical protein